MYKERDPLQISKRDFISLVSALISRFLVIHRIAKIIFQEIPTKQCDTRSVKGGDGGEKGILVGEEPFHALRFKISTKVALQKREKGPSGRSARQDYIKYET